MDGTSLASAAPYALLSIAGLAVAAIAVARFRNRTPKRAGVDAGSALRALSAHEFVAFLGEAFSLQGHQVTTMGVGGIDLTIRKDRETSLVQCKDWRAPKASVDGLRELHRAMKARTVAGGVAVTAGRFSREAGQYAAQYNLRLIEGEVLQAMVRRVQAARDSTARQAATARAG